ncbi:5225ea91-c52b-4386-b491-326d23fb02ef [Thermothielavioides terrestris]|uniref:mRNA export factor MEX67 n=1 Tax=Thermothielavioides terrestris TaxID=2587410 RepID=A0A3S4AJH3_9PEZI|nr:5225ea91-c52b-4386-b491-326d23fb02ef [Thermothielavioides terrestris]
MGSAIPATQSTGPPARSARGSRGARGGRAARSTARLAENVRNYVSDTDSSSRASKAQFNKTTLKIHGLKNSKAASNPDGGLRSLLEFLERKSSKERPITLGRGVIQGDYVFVKVSKDDAPHLLRLNGYTWAGAALAIEETSDPVPGHDRPSAKNPATADTEQKLLGILASRYNAEQKLLDLSALGSDPTLISLGSFASRSLAEKSFKVLLYLTSSQYDDAAAKEQAIQAVSLANNAIQDVAEVFTLAHTLPRLRRLDLSGNQLENLSKLSKWRHEFRRLEELHLVGNPVVAQSNSLSQIVDWFPSLQILNGERVRTPKEAADALAAWFPTPLPRLPSNLRDGENNIASTFLRGFFSLFDHDRAALAAQFYDADSWFSVSVDADHNRDPISQSYIKYSRNIGELGGSAIGLMINIVSQSEEVDVRQQLAGIRTFSRTFVLGPSKPGAPHPYRVVSDQLTLRDWTPQAPAPAAAPAPPAAPIAAVPPAAPDEMTQLAMVQELAGKTGMTAEYSRLCLSGAANWDFNLALASFHEKKAQLPPEAFASSADVL